MSCVLLTHRAPDKSNRALPGLIFVLPSDT